MDNALLPAIDGALPRSWNQSFGGGRRQYCYSQSNSHRKPAGPRRCNQACTPVHATLPSRAVIVTVTKDWCLNLQATDPPAK